MSDEKRYTAEGTETGVAFWLVKDGQQVCLLDHCNRDTLNLLVDALNETDALRRELEQAQGEVAAAIQLLRRCQLEKPLDQSAIDEDISLYLTQPHSGGTILAQLAQAQGRVQELEEDEARVLWKAHVPVTGTQHDPLNGLIHGYCERCRLPWPCPYSPEAKWTPTKEHINTLPEPIRSYIMQLETKCDPAGDLREAVLSRDIIKQLQSRLTAAEARVKFLEEENARLKQDY